MKNVGQNVDRISGLPDPLLHHILSFLPTEYVVQTCFLSKRWTDLWCSIPYLNFDMELHHPDENSLSEFVESVLIRRDGSNLQSFRLSTHLIYHKFDTYFGDEGIYITRMSSWVIFALKHSVEVLDLEFDGVHQLQAIVRRVFMSSTLKELRLVSCEGVSTLPMLEVPNTVCLPNLMILFLRGLDVYNVGNLSRMLSSCPSLHTLSIIYCGFDEEGTLIISTPTLKTFSFAYGGSDIFKLTIDECTSLTTADIEVDTSSESMAQLLRALSKVESLTITSNNVLVFYKEDGLQLNKRVQTPLNALKFLKLEMSLSENHVQLATLLRLSPNIETLVFKNGVNEGRKAQPEGNMELKEELLHLKLVKFYNFRGFKTEVEFIKLIFSKATNLEKLIVIVPKDIKDSEKNIILAEITTILLENPRPTYVSIQLVSQFQVVYVSIQVASQFRVCKFHTPLLLEGDV